MKVLYDYQKFQWGSYGGIARIFFELMDYFDRTRDADFDLALKYTPNVYLAGSRFAADRARPPRSKGLDDFLWGKNFKGKGRLFGLYSKFSGTIDAYAENRQASIDALKAGDFDVFHPTYYDPYFLDYIGDKPYVLTVYDCIHEIFPEMLMWDKSYQSRKKLLERAEKIIAISETTKRDFMQVYDVPEGKIEVIYLASSLDVSQENPSLDLPGRYVLYVGDRAFYKNFYFMVRVLAKIMQTDKDLRLVCVGGGDFKTDEREYFEYLEVANKVVWIGEGGVTTDADIVSAYKNAVAFIYPSLYEGFGIPLVEAFDCGCPVITAKSGPSPEVAGDAAEYFDPKSFSSMYDTIAQVINSKAKQDKMRQRGIERAKMFSWEKTAKQTLSVYKSLL